MLPHLPSLTTLHPPLILMSVLFAARPVLTSVLNALRLVVILCLTVKAVNLTLSTSDPARAERASAVLTALLPVLSMGLFRRGRDR